MNIAVAGRDGVGIHRILVAIDFSESSEKALRHAIAISRSYRASFHLVHVVSSLAYAMVGPDAKSMAAEAASRDMKLLEQHLSQAGAFAGISHKATVCEGEVWQELQRIIEDQNVDLVVVGTHGRTGVRKIAFGSVAEAVFRHATCPVLTVGPCAPADPPLNAQLRHILYPTDLSVESAQAASYVVSLARQHGARLTLVHVVERYTGAANEAQEQEFEAQFRSQVSGEFPHNWTFRTQVGPVDQTILELADQGRVGLIVLGLRSPRSFVHPHGWPHAYKIACEACCPVLTIRCSPGVEL
jgi:nucleotide-binding universal stress UspA family protein